MAKTKKISVTDKNLDRLANFLESETEYSSLAAQIPDGAHIFHGAFNDMDLTQANVELASSMLIEMALGICEEAPLVMVFEHTPNQHTLIDLATETRKHKVHALIEAFQEQNNEEVVTEINELLAA